MREGPPSLGEGGNKLQRYIEVQPVPALGGCIGIREEAEPGNRAAVSIQPCSKRYVETDPGGVAAGKRENDIVTVGLGDFRRRSSRNEWRAVLGSFHSTVLDDRVVQQLAEVVTGQPFERAGPLLIGELIALDVRGLDHLSTADGIQLDTA